MKPNRLPTGLSSKKQPGKHLEKNPVSISPHRRINPSRSFRFISNPNSSRKSQSDASSTESNQGAPETSMTTGRRREEEEEEEEEEERQSHKRKSKKIIKPEGTSNNRNIKTEEEEKEEESKKGKDWHNSGKMACHARLGQG